MLAQGRYAESKVIFEDIVKGNPDFAAAWSNLGYTLLLLQHDDTLAEKMYDRALALSPDYKQAQLNKVGVYLYRKNNSAARKMLEDMLKQDASNEEAREILNKLRTS